MCKLMLKNPKTLDKEKITVINKRRAFNKAIGSEKKYKIDKRRAYVYSGL